MFGWLAARATPLCHRASSTVVTQRYRPIVARDWLHRLPSLGSVLYLHAASMVMQHGLSPGVLAMERAFAPLLATHWLVATSVVTDDGPREWFECVDRFGVACARLHLLPDTDYLAWDALAASCGWNGCPPIMAGTLPRKLDEARVVVFQWRRLAGLWSLESGSATRLSRLGNQIAARIAASESAELAG